MKDIINREKAAELQRLCTEYLIASVRTADSLVRATDAYGRPVAVVSG